MKLSFSIFTTHFCFACALCMVRQNQIEERGNAHARQQWWYYCNRQIPIQSQRVVSLNFLNKIFYPLYPNHTQSVRSVCNRLAQCVLNACSTNSCLKPPHLIEIFERKKICFLPAWIDILCQSSIVVCTAAAKRVRGRRVKIEQQSSEHGMFISLESTCIQQQINTRSQN